MGAQDQDFNVLPPRRGRVLAISVDSTARAYDLSALAFGVNTPEAAGLSPRNVFVTMMARGADVFYYFSSATASDLDDTAAITAGSAAVYANTYGVPLPDGSRDPVRLSRSIDKFIILKCASGSTAKFYLWASSLEEGLGA